MKYRRKQYYVDVTEYKPGMEDGFIGYCGFFSKEILDCKSERPGGVCKNCARDWFYQTAYIDNKGDRLYIGKGDYIISENGKSRAISKAELDRGYDFICK